MIETKSLRSLLYLHLHPGLTVGAIVAVDELEERGLISIGMTDIVYITPKGRCYLKMVDDLPSPIKAAKPEWMDPREIEGGYYFGEPEEEC